LIGEVCEPHLNASLPTIDFYDTSPTGRTRQFAAAAIHLSPGP